MSPKIGELFAGYSGLGMGVQSVYGGELAWYADVCKFDKDGNASHHEPHRAPCSIMTHHYPDVPNLGDVSAVDWSQVEPVDILTAVLRALGRVLGDLSDLGYDCRWHGIRAADVGAPHGRFRVFVAATNARHRAGHGEWARQESRQGDPTLAVSADIGPVGSKSHDWLMGHGNVEAQVLLLPTPAVNDMGASYTPEEWDAWTARMKAEHGNGNGHGKSLSIEAQRLLPTPEAADASGGRQSAEVGGKRPSGAKRAINLGTVTAPAHASRWGDYAAAIARWEHILGRPAPAPTQMSTKGNPQLSAKFVEWLMGLPAGWVTDVPGITRNEALKALGNGVVPQQAAAALRVMATWEAVA